MSKAERAAAPGRIIAAPESHLTAEVLRGATRSRRGFLQGGAALAGAVAAVAGGRAFAQEKSAFEPPNVPSWTRSLGAPVVASPYGKPSKFEANVQRRQSPGLTPQPQSSVSFTPLQNLFGIVTPSGLHFERHHQGWWDIDPSQHRLMVNGLVAASRAIFTMDDLMRLPSVSRFHFIECGANTGMEWGNVAVPTVQYTHGMLACSEFTGVPLSTLLDEGGVDTKNAKFVLAEGADGSSLTRTIPMEMALGRRAWSPTARTARCCARRTAIRCAWWCRACRACRASSGCAASRSATSPGTRARKAIHYIDLMPDGMHRQYTWIQEARA